MDNYKIKTKKAIIFVIICFLIETHYSTNSSSECIKTSQEKISINSGNIVWPLFSLTDYKQERSLLRKIWRKDFDEMELLFNENVKVYIASVDLCGNKYKEIIAYFIHPAYCGSHGCTLLIYKWVNRKFSLIDPPLLSFIDIDIEGNQRNFGVLTITQRECKDIVVNNTKRKWDGYKYTLEDK